MADVVDSLHSAAMTAPLRFVRGASGWLGLAAAPSFALMALISGMWGRAGPDMLCSAMPGESVLGGMIPMYLLMSVFHAAPWLKLISGRWMHR